MPAPRESSAPPPVEPMAPSSHVESSVPSSHVESSVPSSRVESSVPSSPFESAVPPSESESADTALSALELDALASRLAAASVCADVLAVEDAPLDAAIAALGVEGVPLDLATAEPAIGAGDLASGVASAEEDGAAGLGLPAEVLVADFPGDEADAVLALPVHRPSRRAAILALALGAALTFFVAFLLSKRHGREAAPRPAASVTARVGVPAPASAPTTVVDAPASEPVDELAEPSATPPVRRGGSPGPVAAPAEPEPAAPGGPSVGRFPDLPRDVLIKLERSANGQE
jgi:hypothetical protein